MQYALLDGFERKFLLDALEFGVLKDWKENPVKELPDIDESAHPFHVCYGGYLLNPGVSVDWPHESPDNQYHLNK